MQLATIAAGTTTELVLLGKLGVCRPAVAIDAWPQLRDVGELLRHGQRESLLAQLRALAAGNCSWQPLEPAQLRAPVLRPPKNIMCLGWNYADHARESMHAKNIKGELPEHPVVFTKAASAVNGPFAGIPDHAAVTQELDWEVELGVVIGRDCVGVSVDQAMDCVFGYTVINDVSARDLQARHKQFFLGKSLPGSCPMGPALVTADEIADPQRLQLRCLVNGQVKQDSNTSHQIFTVAEVVSLLSRLVGLEPGDVIATGTPSGVGFARTPPQFLRAGDEVICEIEGIGRLQNTVFRSE